MIELIGFFVIGGNIGFLLSVLWLISATSFGFWLLQQGGMRALSRKADDENEFFAVQEAFDSLCMMIAALLLIFPGFISDFIAIPFVLAPFRHWLFGYTKNKPDSYMHKFTRQSRNFRQWTYSHTQSTTEAKPATTTIEGEFKRVDDTDHISKQ